MESCQNVSVQNVEKVEENPLIAHGNKYSVSATANNVLWLMLTWRTITKNLRNEKTLFGIISGCSAC